MSSRTKQLQKMLEGFHNWKVSASEKDRRIPQAFQVTGSQWLVLGVIERKKTASIKEIGAALHISSSAATQIVNELEKRGSVLKKADAKDRRIALVALSAKAKKDMARMRAMVLKRLQKMYAVLSDQEFATYMALTDKVIAGIKQNS